jgi:hypothetical protein
MSSFALALGKQVCAYALNSNVHLLSVTRKIRMLHETVQSYIVWFQEIIYHYKFYTSISRLVAFLKRFNNLIYASSKLVTFYRINFGVISSFKH